MGFIAYENILHAQITCKPLVIVASQKICGDLNRRVAPSKIIFQKLISHLPQKVGRWINSATNKQRASPLECHVFFFLPVSCALLSDILGELLTNIFPQSEGWLMKSHAAWTIKCIDQPPGPTFFCPKGLKKLPFSCWPKSLVSIWQAWNFFGDAKFGRQTFGQQLLRHGGFKPAQ